jgi:hypothetical protein
MTAQNIDGTSLGTGVYNTKVPGYDDPADIQAALKLFLYGSTTFDPAAAGAIDNLPNPSMRSMLWNQQDLDLRMAMSLPLHLLDISGCQIPQLLLFR